MAIIYSNQSVYGVYSRLHYDPEDMLSFVTSYINNGGSEWNRNLSDSKAKLSVYKTGFYWWNQTDHWLI